MSFKQISPKLLEKQLATQQEIDEIVQGLESLETDNKSVVAGFRKHQVCGTYANIEKLLNNPANSDTRQATTNTVKTESPITLKRLTHNFNSKTTIAAITAGTLAISFFAYRSLTSTSLAQNLSQVLRPR